MTKAAATTPAAGASHISGALQDSPRLSAALRSLATSWVGAAGPKVAVAAHGVRALSNLTQGLIVYNAGPRDNLSVSISLHSPEEDKSPWAPLTNHGPSLTEGINSEMPNDVHSAALYLLLGLSMVILFADVAFGWKCREAKTQRAAGLSHLNERLAELNLKREAPAPGSEPAPSSEEAAAEWADFMRTRLKFLLLTCTLGFASELLLWMLAPFLPLEASTKGVSPELIGLLFACHPIALGISSHLAPWLMRNVEPFVLLQRTLFLQAVFISGFGLAGGIDATLPFVCCAAINRFMLGFMSGINEPTSQAITLRVVPTHAIGYAFGLIISSRFTAMLVGPAIGGALYSAGGFTLPFLVSGGVYLLLGALTMYVGTTTPAGRAAPPPGDLSVCSLLRVRGMGWMLGCIFLLWFNVMALEPCYQPFLAQASPRRRNLPGPHPHQHPPLAAPSLGCTLPCLHPPLASSSLGLILPWPRPFRTLPPPPPLASPSPALPCPRRSPTDSRSSTSASCSRARRARWCSRCPSRATSAASSTPTRSSRLASCCSSPRCPSSDRRPPSTSRQRSPSSRAPSSRASSPSASSAPPSRSSACASSPTPASPSKRSPPP